LVKLGSKNNVFLKFFIYITKIIRQVVSIIKNLWRMDKIFTKTIEKIKISKIDFSIIDTDELAMVEHVGVVLVKLKWIN
jgi:hypothetical protein